MEHKGSILILGIGNLLQGDEGVGVHVVRRLQEGPLPPHVECLDGGTGGFVLLEPIQAAQQILLIDAAANDAPPGSIQVLRPQFSRDYPKTLTAHEIGLKDVLDGVYLLKGRCDVTLYAISIDPVQPLSMTLSTPVAVAATAVEAMIRRELSYSRSPKNERAARQE